MRVTAFSALVLSVCALSAAPLAARATDVGDGVEAVSPNDAKLTIPVTASIGVVCSVVSGGTPPAGDFGRTVNLGDITDAGGHLTAAIRGSSDAFAAAGQAATFQINCNGANNAISIKATPLATGGAPPASGYVTAVNYTADAVYALTGGGTKTQSTSSDSGVHNDSLGVGATLANAGGDVVIKAHNFTTTNPTSDILVASSAWAGTITVTIGPGV